MDLTLLSLIQLGVGRLNSEIPDCIDWEIVHDDAIGQGVAGIVSDSIVYLQNRGLLIGGRAIDKPTKKKWVATTFNYEQRYHLYRKSIGELASFYSCHGFKMMVLKGYGLSLNYPTPEHRPCGDIDIWLFGKYKEADRILTEETGIQVDKSRMHHTVFHWNGFMVENHFEIVNTQANHSNAKIDKLFEELAMDDSNSIAIDGHTVFLPSAIFHLLFLLRHTIQHFNGEGIVLRQILDWGFFIEKNKEQIDWVKAYSVIEQYRMTVFFNCLNAICVENLGFSADCFPKYTIDDKVKNRVLESILVAEEKKEMPANPIKRLLHKLKRRRARKWKHDICYKESQMSHLWSSVWLHLRHPETI